MATINDLNPISVPADDSVIVVTDATSSKKITVLDLKSNFFKQASSTQAGSVKVGTGLSINADGILSVSNYSDYTLPKATTSSLGGVIVGAGLAIDTAGVLTVSSATIPSASTLVSGTVKVGTGLVMNQGVLSTAFSQYELPSATEVVLGGIRVGSGLIMDNSMLSTQAKTFLTEGDQIVTDNYTTANNKTVYSIGTITLDRTVTFTVERNATWTIYTPGAVSATIPVIPPAPPIQEQDTTIIANYSISNNKIASSIGPVVVDRNVTVEVAPLSTWIIF